MCPLSLPQAPKTLDAGQGPLLLQICGGPRQGQIIPFRAAKCTVGAGHACTHRIVARGVEPLHCLIVRGTAATVVRSLSPHTRLNGQRFGDAVLRPGDRLSIGPVDFQVISLQALNRDPAGLRSALPSGGTLPSQLLPHRKGGPPCEVSRPLPAPAPEPPESLAAQTSAEDRLAARCTELDARQAALDTRQAELERFRGELEARAAELDQRQTELDQRQSELDRHQTDLDRRQAELDRRQAELNHQLAAWESRGAERQARQAALDTRQEALERLEAQLNARQEELAREGRALQDRHQQLQQRLAEWEQREVQLAQREARIAQREAPLDVGGQSPTPEVYGVQLSALQAPADCSAEDGPVGQRNAGAGPAAAEAPQWPGPVALAGTPLSPGAPVDTETIFQRLGIRPPADDEPEEADPSVAPGGATSAEAPAAPGDEESIDVYMSRLLQRLRQASGREQASSAESPETGSVPYAEVAPSLSSGQQTRGLGASGGEEPPEPAGEPSPHPGRTRRRMLPKSAAPEDLSHLAAMRELANLSARNALDRHGRNLLRRAILSKLAVLALALTAGSSLMALWWWLGAGELAYYAALVCYLVAVVWGIQYAVLSGRLVVSRSGHLGWHSSSTSAQHLQAPAAEPGSTPPTNGEGPTCDEGRKTKV